MANALVLNQHKTLDSFYENVLSKEPTVRSECFSELENYLLDQNTSLQCQDLTGFINGLFKWIEGSNFRIAQNGLRILELFNERLDSNEFECFLDSVILITIDRLGDAKDQVREAASNLLIKLMKTYNPQKIWNLVQSLGFDNKQYRIKEECQLLLVKSLNEFGASTIQLNKLVPLICKLVSDSNSTVRQQAIDTLVEIYRHVGEKVRCDIAKRDLPEAKLKQLYEKFDDVIANGRMIVNSSDTTDDVRPNSATAKSRSSLENNSLIRSRPSSGTITRNSISNTTAAGSGAVDESIFEDTFNSSHPISFTSGKDVENQLLSIRDILADTNNDWEKRVEALKRLRSIVAGGADEYEEFFRNLRQLDLCLVATVKDLRSQIVREVCITLAFMSVRLTNRFERTAEGVIPAMLNLIQNSAKVIATSGIISLHYIVTNTQSTKLTPLILTGIESKSKDIRRYTYELLIIMLSNWESIYLEKHGQLIHDVIKKGLSDADPDARSFARKSFGFFRESFPILSDALLASLDPSKKKTLLGEMSNASSTHSLASIGSSRRNSAKEISTKQGRTGINGQSRIPPQSTSTTKNTRQGQTVSQSQPGSRSTSPNSLRSSQNLSSTLRTPTSARSRIPIGSNAGSKISSRESSPGRIPVSTSAGGNRRRLGRAYGHRTAASDYGDHPGGRRVSASLYGDSGDDASETSSICSERSLEDIADVLRRMSSNEWTERKESLVSLYHMIRSNRVFSPIELKRLTELLTKRFYDPNSQVFASFLDVLPEFIAAYKRDLNEWLYLLLTRLLIRLGAPEILDSVSKKLKQCLFIVNSSFDVHGQFLVLIRFINDNSAAPSIKVKEILMRYFQQIIQQMEPVDITNNTDIRIALSKIINWSSEPKSIEMRKAAQAVILALHNLNRPEFNIMLTALPQTYQDVAAKIVRSSNEMQSSTHSQVDTKFDFFRRSSVSGLTSMHSDVSTSSYSSDMRILMENMKTLNVNNRQDDLSLTNSSKIKDKEHRSMIPVRNYIPQTYSSQTSDSIVDANDRPAAIDIALNMANTTTLTKDERQHALRCLLKFAKIDDNETWDIAFNKTLNILTQILDNSNDEVNFKVYSLRIIRELLIHHTNFFMNYIELTIFRILKAQSENESEITRSAEQAAHAAAEHLPAESTVRVLKPIIEQAKYPMNQSAITMLQKTIELMNKETCVDLMPEMIPSLLTSWDNETSSVRKSVVFCLVSIYFIVGDKLRVHLNKLTPSKLKLLNVYISKAQQQADKTSGDSQKATTTNEINNNNVS